MLLQSPPSHEAHDAVREDGDAASAELNHLVESTARAAVAADGEAALAYVHAATDGSIARLHANLNEAIIELPKSIPEWLANGRAVANARRAARLAAAKRTLARTAERLEVLAHFVKLTRLLRLRAEQVAPRRRFAALDALQRGVGEVGSRSSGSGVGSVDDSGSGDGRGSLSPNSTQKRVVFAADHHPVVSSDNAASMGGGAHALTTQLVALERRLARKALVAVLQHSIFSQPRVTALKAEVRSRLTAAIVLDKQRHGDALPTPELSVAVWPATHRSQPASRPVSPIKPPAPSQVVSPKGRDPVATTLPELTLAGVANQGGN